MLDLEAVRKLSSDQRIVRFAEFVASGTDANALPDYHDFDLMEIASLVRYVFVIKVLPAGDKRLLFHFSGSQFDDLYAQNVTGKYLEDFYTGKNRGQVLSNFYDIIETRRPYYYVNSERFVSNTYSKGRKVTRLAVPCSSNGREVDYIIALAVFDEPYDGEDERLIPL